MLVLLVLVAMLGWRTLPVVLALAFAVMAAGVVLLWPAVGALVLLMYGLTSEAGFRRRPGAVMPGPPASAHA